LHHIPNIISVIRILLVVPTAMALWNHQYQQALVLMFVAGVSDAVDGALARRFDWTSELGKALDPIADKLLVGVTIVVFTIQAHLPVWVALIVLSRDVIILVGAAAYRRWFERVGFNPTFLSKANTAFQIVTLLVLLVALCEFPTISAWADAVVDPHLFYVLAVLGVASGADYVVTWGQRARTTGKKSAALVRARGPVLPPETSFRDASNSHANAGLCNRLLALGSTTASGDALWVHGKAGSGKTHLLQGVVARLSDARVSVAYLPAKTLVANQAVGMLEGSERYSLLVIDDVDCWLGTLPVEQELVRIYQERRHSGQHLLMSAARAPSGYQMALPDWQSRAQGAEVLPLAELTDADKLSVMQLRATRLGLELNDAVASYLLRRGPRDLPAMLEVLARVDGLALAEQRRLTVPLLKKVLAGEGGST